ncbi:MAG: rhodanese-like domain-containing protein [Planctomycetota bacterium]
MNDGDMPLEVDVVTVAEMQKTGHAFVLLDVREQPEFVAARIDGSRLIPMSELADRVQELEEVRDEHIVVHCHHGVRSLQVTHALRQAGFARTQSMAGGIDQWSDLVDHAVPKY